MPLTEDKVRNAVVSKLSSMKYHPRTIKSLSEHGVDIKARHERFSRYFLVEVKGDPSDGVKSASAGREVRFLQGLGQLITRIQPERGYYYGLAFPSSYRDIVIRRLHPALLKLLKIHLFFVDDRRRVEYLTWRHLRATGRLTTD